MLNYVVWLIFVGQVFEFNQENFALTGSIVVGEI
jgi:hypothetical protein